MVRKVYEATRLSFLIRVMTVTERLWKSQMHKYVPNSQGSKLGRLGKVQVKEDVIRIGL